MSDTSNVSDRLNAAVEAARQGLEDLRTRLAAAASGVADDVSAAVDALGAKIDEIQAAAAERNQAQ